MAELLVNEILDAQVEDVYADGNQFNGYRERKFATSVGTMNLRIPELGRDSYFLESLLVHYPRVSRTVIAAVPEIIAIGASTRIVERIAQIIGIKHMSTSQVPRTCKSLDGAVADLSAKGRELTRNRASSGAERTRCGHAVLFALLILLTFLENTRLALVVKHIEPAHTVFGYILEHHVD